MPVPSVGSLAPDFTLPSTSGEPVTLSAYRGRHPVLLAFFPLAFSGVCTAEMCAFTEDYDQFAGRGVVVHPVSVDSKYALREFKAKHAMQVELLSDFCREVSALYGVLLPERSYSTRAYFLIDAGGVVRWAHVEETPGTRRDNAELLREIDRLDEASAAR
jgi:peroxiredoxin